MFWEEVWKKLGILYLEGKVAYKLNVAACHRSRGDACWDEMVTNGKAVEAGGGRYSLCRHIRGQLNRIKSIDEVI